jgi:hypothetical protein
MDGKCHGQGGEDEGSAKNPLWVALPLRTYLGSRSMRNDEAGECGYHVYQR